MNKKILFVLLLTAVLLAGGGLAYRAYASSQAAAQSALQTATVTRGSLTSTLSSSGNVRSGQTANLSWETSGKVGAVTLQPGDRVAVDQELAALDPDDLSTEMITAKQSLLAAQAALDDLLTSKTGQAQALQAVENAQKTLNSLKVSSAEERSQAQLALANAQEALADAQKTRNAMNYPHSSDPLIIEKAQTDYLLAKQAYKEALQAFNEVAHKKLTNPERIQALNRLVSAEQAMDTKLTTYNWYLLHYSDSDIAQADATLAVAQANLEKAQADWDLLKDGASPAAIAMAEATLADALRDWEDIKDGPSADDIAAAQAAVDVAQATLDQARLLAPFAGTLTDVDVKTGDLVSPGDSAFRLDDLANLYIDLQISEVDLASLQTGLPATLEFDAIPDREYNGTVVSIGMIGSVTQGVVNYPVTVQVTDPDSSILPGMTASVTIILEQHDDVLLVPNKAIRTSAGQRTVTILFEGQQITLPVTVGLSNSSLSEVTSDQLREGDTVLINGTTATTTTTTTNNRGGNGFEMPGGGPPGGGMFP